MAGQTKQRKRRSNQAPLVFAIGILSVVLVIVVLIALSLDRPDTPNRQTEPSQTQAAPTQSQPVTGWFQENGSTMYRLADGTVATEWLVLENQRYYLGSDGVLRTGWQDIHGGRYYLAADGVMHTGWLEQDGKHYYLSTDGILQTGWLETDSNRYYLTEDGSAVTGWATVDTQEYYFRENGAMARGVVEIEGTRHHFTSAGIPILVANPWNFIPEGYDPELKELPRELGEDHFVVAGDCYDRLVEMLRACNTAMKEEYTGSGGKIPQAYVISSFRTHQYQSNAYQNKINRVMAADPTLTREEAEVIAAQVVAYPGTSEHQLGLAVDIIDTQLWKLEQEQENLPAQQWLMANSWQYGFILRYPKDKTDSTGIIYEPWHYRYVGLEVAKEIHDSGMTLEQYLESLS